ncbi:MAG: hypothetical protein KGZ75_04865 [Syntrophomonadaceae bacterium]|nr:hypothetical protein [Syntrophomonadaceae bacterium]
MRPNVEVNRRVEGTPELSRRLGAVEKGAAALRHCPRLWPRTCRKASAVCLCRFTKAEQQDSNREAQPEREAVESGSQTEA